MAVNLLSAAGTIVSAVIGVLAAGIVVFTVVRQYVCKKQGKGGCDCGCAGCSGCSACAAREKKGGKSANTRM